MKKLLFTLALPTLLLCVGPSAAAAGSAQSEESRVIQGDEIKAAAKGLKQDAKTDAAIESHVASQAREGRLVDSKNVKAAAFDNATLTWETGSFVDEARYAKSKTKAKDGATEDEVLELAFISAEDPDAPADGGAVQALSGAGMTGASFSGGTRLTSACQTWTVQGRSMTGCYQKFKPTSDGSSTRDYYAYNRWGTATGQSSFPFNWWPVYVDIRSRPWVGYGSRIVGMTNYFPIDGSQLCNEGSSVDIKLGSLALGIGLTNCADKYPIPNATTRTMGLIYDDGFIFGGPLSKGVDFEMEVFNWQGGATPIFGDYNYAKFCSGTLLNCTGTLGKNGW